MVVETGDLQGLLDGLGDNELAYVWERSKVRTDKAGYEAAGISESTFYRWSPEVRERLNDLALRLKRERLVAVDRVLLDHAIKAASILVKGLDSRKEHIAQKAANDVLDRVAGKPGQRISIEGSEGGPVRLVIEYVNDWRDPESTEQN